MTSFENEYYRVDRHLPVWRGSRWRASAQIIRKDTGEAETHISASGDSFESAKSELDRLIRERMEGSSRPKDWGRDPTVPSLIRAAVAAKEQVLSAAWTPKPESQSVEEWTEQCRAKDDALEAKSRADFARLVAELSEDRKVELVTLTLRERRNPIDAWVLDEISARYWLYDLIDEPSAELRAAYSKMRAELEEDVAALPEGEANGGV